MSSPDRVLTMSDAFSQSRPTNELEEQILFWDHMNEHRFEPQDMEYIIARFKIRKENRILASGSKYPDPFAWELALERARLEEDTYHRRLTEEHGYPDTTGKDWREAHQARLRFLMGKYPSADWELLLRGQFDGRDRKPPEVKVRPITIQVIEHTKQAVIALTQQREELNAYGKIPTIVEQQDRAIARKKHDLEQYGVDPKELLKENRPRWVLVPLLRSETDRLIARVNDLSSLLVDMQALQGADDEEPELITATRRVLNTYRQTLTKFGVDPDTHPVSESSTLPVNASFTIPNARSDTRSDTLPAPAPEVDPVIDPVPHPISTPKVDAARQEQAPGEEPLLDARQAAKLLGVAYTTMLNELKSGRFPFANMVGGKWRISRKGLLDWLEGHRTDVETLKQSSPVVPKKTRGKKAEKPPVVRPDGRLLSF